LNCLWNEEVVEFIAWSISVEWSAMSDRSSGEAQTVVPLAPKSNGKLEAGDPLDAAGQAILGMLHRAADAAEANYQQTLKMTEKLSGQLRAAENQIRELEAKVRHHQDGADRTERWLHQISAEIEQRFFGSASWSSRQPSPQQALSRNQGG
jgi:peptidoglycan hydrolase CwlO-like protein